jgi:hypothetical protein
MSAPRRGTPEPLIAAARRVSRLPMRYFEMAGSQLRGDACKAVRGIEGGRAGYRLDFRAKS